MKLVNRDISAKDGQVNRWCSGVMVCCWPRVEGLPFNPTMPWLRFC